MTGLERRLETMSAPSLVHNSQQEVGAICAIAHSLAANGREPHEQTLGVEKRKDENPRSQTRASASSTNRLLRNYECFD